jgi:serine/threonine protein kinase/Tol biopolymer transport system component
LDRISHYRILGRIGSGGMGEVYRGLDERLGREVAIKLLKATGSGQAERQVRLLREAQAASALNHPNIVTVYDVGTHESRPFLVMELVEGRRLSDLKNVEPRQALLLCAQAAEALAAAHARGILHRDVKSDNLMVLPDGRVKVLDFGLAKLSGGGASSSSSPTDSGSGRTASQSADPLGETLGPEESDQQHNTAPTVPLSSPSPLVAALTRMGDVIGTPAYMAPEQTEGKPADARSEVFSLGVVAYELLVGRRPFAGATINETLELVRTRDPVLPSTAAGKPALRKVDFVVMRALAKDPAARHADMRELAAELRRAAARLAPPKRGRMVAAVIGFAVVAAAGVLALRSRGSAPPPVVQELRPQNVHRLTRQEGCEEFPVFTADGKSVLYDHDIGRDYALFEVPAEGGASRRITNASGWDLAPVVSPDGTQVAFLRKGDGPMSTWVAPLGHLEQARSLGGGGTRPAWSPDGKFVWTGGGSGITRRDAATGKIVRTIPPPADHRPLMLRELADGRVLVMVFPRQGALFPDGVAVYSSTSDQPVWLIQKTELEEVLAISPSGQSIVVARQTANANIELMSIPLAGGPPHPLTVLDVLPRKGLAISPDGGRMVWSDCRQATTLAVLGKDADGKPRLTDLAQNDWLDEDPYVIPGTEDVLVISDRSGGPELWRMDRNHKRQPAALGFGKDADTLAVSADGKQVAYADEAGFWVAPLDGSARPRKVIEVHSESPATFRRDGRALFFEAVDEKSRPRIGEVSIDGGAPRWLVTMARAPAASPTEDVLAYLELVEDAALPRLSDLKTGKSRPLAPALAGRAWTGLRFSPDGKRLLVLRNSGTFAVVDVHSGKVQIDFDAGADQIVGGAFVGDEVIVGRTVWKGDLWIADLAK